jgi:hypothetical protein
MPLIEIADCDLPVPLAYPSSQLTPQPIIHCRGEGPLSLLSDQILAWGHPPGGGTMLCLRLLYLSNMS